MGKLLLLLYFIFLKIYTNVFFYLVCVIFSPNTNWSSENSSKCNRKPIMLYLFILNIFTY